MKTIQGQKMDSPEPSDQELMKGVREEDQGHLVLLIQRYQNMVLKTAYAYSRNWHDAEEIAQGVFVKVYRRARQFDAKAKLSTWIYRITINESTDFLRKAKRRPWFLATAGPHQRELEDFPIPAPQANARAVTEHREIHASIERAVGKLPERQRSVFTLFYTQGLKLEEIAEVLQVSLGNVKAQLWQAREKMKHELAPLFLSSEGRVSL